MGLGVQRRVLTCGRQAMRHRPGLRLDRLPAQARQPGLTGNGLVGCAIVTNHAPADTQRLGRSTQGQAIAGHPAVEHLVADLVGLFLGPGVDVIRAEFLVNPLDAVAPLADVDTGEHGWIKDGGQCRMAAQAILNVNLQHLAGAPGGVPGSYGRYYPTSQSCLLVVDGLVAYSLYGKPLAIAGTVDQMLMHAAEANF